MASRVLPLRLGFRGIQQTRTQCRVHPRRFLTLSSRLQLAAKRSPLKKPHPPKSSPPTTPPNPKPDTPESQTLDILWKQRKIPLIGAGAFVFCMSLYISLIVTKLNKATDAWAAEHATPTGLPSSITSALTTNQTPEEIRQTADNFDRDLDFPERVTGTRRLRKKLAARARGHVLEVSIGTGRNLPFYTWTDLVATYTSSPSSLAQRQREHMDRLLDSPSLQTTTSKLSSRPEMKQIGSLAGEILTFTGLDISPDMLEIARTRIRDSIPTLEQTMFKRRQEPMPIPNPAGGTPQAVVDVLNSRVRLFMGDAQSALPPPPSYIPPTSSSSTLFPPDKYDTILQTFGLCSVADPGVLLANMAAVVKPDSGRIILLEHGRGWYDWINTKLDQFALPHFQRYGCWWNRDIEGIVREAAGRIPGLEVVGVERPLLTHFGTTLVIELRVRGGGEKGA